MSLKSVAVFCGSSPGKNPKFLEAAEALGRYLAKHNIELIYGGSSAGLMGAVSQSAADAGGKVTGVLPEFFLNRERFIEGMKQSKVGECVLVSDMHARKKTMMEKSNALIALPGGVGTVDELFEAISWLQLGLHDKPVGILNVDSYYKGLLDWLDNAVQEDLVARRTQDIVLVADDSETLMHKIEEQLNSKT